MLLYELHNIKQIFMQLTYYFLQFATFFDKPKITEALLNLTVPPKPKPVRKRKRREDSFYCKVPIPLETRRSERLANITPEYKYTDLEDEVTLCLLTFRSVTYFNILQELEKRRRYSSSDINDIERPIFRPAKRFRKGQRASSAPFVPVEEITEDYLSKIAVSSTTKIYNTDTGTSCHQCRQKTVDSKTYCRSGKCIGKGYTDVHCSTLRSRKV